MNKSVIKNIVIFVIVFLAISAIFSLYNMKTNTVETVDIQKMITEINDGTVQTVEIKGNTLNLTLTDGKKQTLQKETTDSFSTLMNNFQVSPEKLQKVGIQVSEEGGIGYWMSALLPFLIPFILIIGFIWYMMRQVQGANSKAMNFGQSQARMINQTAKNRVTFEDVAGVREAKEELVEVVDF